MKQSGLIASLFIILSLSAYAHDNDPLFNQVSLQAQVEREIPNDQLTVMLAAEAEGKEAAKIADRINKDIDRKSVV